MCKQGRMKLNFLICSRRPVYDKSASVTAPAPDDKDTFHECNFLLINQVFNDVFVAHAITCFNIQTALAFIYNSACFHFCGCFIFLAKVNLNCKIFESFVLCAFRCFNWNSVFEIKLLVSSSLFQYDLFFV